jgi:hypothetical protein
MEQGRQVKKVIAPRSGPTRGWELLIPNPKLKLMDQVREVLRVKHYAIRTEQAYCGPHVLRQGGNGMKSPLDCL